MSFDSLKMVSSDMYDEYQQSLGNIPYLCTPCKIPTAEPPSITCYMEISKQPPFDLTDITLMVRDFRSIEDGITEMIDFIVSFIINDSNSISATHVELREWHPDLVYEDILKILENKLII